MADLPTDIIHTEIFPKLPTKSLHRLKCVSKSFKALILSSEFLALQLHHSISSDANRFLIINQREDDDSVLYVYSLDDESPAFIPPPPNNHLPGDVALRMVGCCNGLLLLSYMGAHSYPTLFLLNPSTRICVFLPPDVLDYRLYFNDQLYGLGYDSLSDDYEVVYIVDHPTNDGGVARDVGVYSLRSKKWNLVDRVLMPSDEMRHDGGNGFGCVLIDNHLLHWKFLCASEKKHRIRCFNIRSESWDKDVPLPADLAASVSSGAVLPLVDLGVLDGCLCLLAQRKKQSRVYVWVMKDYGVQESWVRLLRLCIDDTSVTKCLRIAPLAYRRGSKSEILQIIRYGNELRLVWCNTKDKRYKQAKLNGADGIRSVDEAFVCKGSLVALPDGGELCKIVQ